MIEPIIVIYFPVSPGGIAVQTVVLCLSTLCFVLLLCADRGFEGAAFAGSVDLLKQVPVTNFAVTAFKHMQHLMSRGDYVFELFCFLTGKEEFVTGNFVQ